MRERATAVEAVRRANLGEVLRLVHHEGTRSRSLITAETGLNRSTVADLVTALVEHGLVIEQDPDPTRRVGRPSPAVTASPDILAIGVNPEVDAIEIGAVGLDGVLRARTRIELESVPSPADAVRVIVEAVEDWRRADLDGRRVIGLGVAVPGLVRAADGLVRFAPHLQWRDEDIASPLADALGVPVTVDNDASLGARAEHLFGAAREHDDVVYLNGGASGIGGGLVLHGGLIAGAGGYAGEWGQTRPSISAEADRRTERGVLEDEVNRGRLLEAAGLSGADDLVLAAALAESGTDAVTDEVARQRRILAATLANAVNVLNPSMIVLGGFLAMLRESDPEAFAGVVRAHALAAPGEQVSIRPAALGADRLLIGAAEAAFAPLLADPLGALAALTDVSGT